MKSLTSRHKNANAFASTFYFFPLLKPTAEKNKKSLQANASGTVQEIECVLTLNDTAPKVAQQLTESLAKILKKGGLVVNQTVVFLMKCVQAKKNATEESGKNLYLFVAFFLTNSIASNPPFLKLRQALMR